VARIHVFADEAGNFDFSGGLGASRYFILTTVAMQDFRADDALLALRRQLAWEGYPQATPDFHASEELQAVRDRVFEELAKWDFEVDSTIFNKRLTAPELTGDDVGFYRAAWQTHFDKVAPSLFGGGDELLVMGAFTWNQETPAGFPSCHRGCCGQPRRNYAIPDC
jgi:hypothetical protein